VSELKNYPIIKKKPRRKNCGARKEVAGIRPLQKNNPENVLFSGNAAKQTQGGPLAPSLFRTVTVGSGISPDHASL